MIVLWLLHTPALPVLVEWCAIAAALLGCVLGTQFTGVHVALMPDSHAFSAHCVPAAIGSPFFVIHVIGDFPEAEARRFFEECVLPQFFGGVSYNVGDADWAKVYQVRWLRVVCFALCMTCYACVTLELGILTQ